MELIHKQEETPEQRKNRQAIEFEQMFARIRAAQVHAGEQIVIQSLRDKGLID